MKKVIVLILTLAVLTGFSAPAFANNPSFIVSAIYPEGQLTDEGFFDVLVTTNQELDLTLSVTNNGYEDTTVVIDVIAATTGANGQIVYSTQGEIDSSMLYPLTDLVTENPITFIAPARSTSKVPVTLTTPPEQFEGIILGALRVINVSDTVVDYEKGIESLFPQVIAVRLTSDLDRIVKPEILFEDIDLSVESKENTAFLSFTGKLCNVQSEIFKNVQVSYKVIDSSSATVRTGTETIELAPNSFYDFSYEASFLSTPDTYKMITEVSVDDEVFTYAHDFEIKDVAAENQAPAVVVGSGQARVPAEGASDTPEPVTDNWLYLIIAGVGVSGLLCVVSILLLVKGKKRARSESDLQQVCQVSSQQPQYLPVQQAQSPPAAQFYPSVAGRPVVYSSAPCVFPVNALQHGVNKQQLAKGVHEK